MITISSLRKKYHSNGRTIQALDGIDLEIGTGMFGLLGPNGAGKTTLMRILAGIANPSEGSVIAEGYDLSSMSGKQELKAILGYLPQELGLYKELTAYQFVDYMAVLKGMNDPKERQKQVEKVLSLVGLEKDAKRKIKGFSGGMKRRVGIAQALVNDPAVLIVDEPTAGLDPEERIRFRNLLVNLSTDRTVILSTHIVEDIAQTCNDLAILAKGKVIFRGSPGDLTHAAEGHVWTLLRSGLERPNHQLRVVSMLHLSEGIQYRLVGEVASDYPDAQEVQPSLEDGYMWIMKNAGYADSKEESF